MKMNEVRWIKYDEFNNAIEFANNQFQCDFKQVQPKLYSQFNGGQHVAYFHDGKIVGMFSAYPVVTDKIRVLSLGTVCVDEDFRGKGIMGELFVFAARELYHKYDLIELTGARHRYEHLGFFKTGRKIIFNIKRRKKCVEPYEIKEITKYMNINMLSKLYKGDIQRKDSSIFNVLATHSSRAYICSLKGKHSYLVYNENKNTVYELYGENDTMDVLQSFMEYKNLEAVDLFDSIDCSKDLFYLSDKYTISTLCNLKIINYEKVIECLLDKVKNKMWGTISISVEGKFCLNISVLFDGHIHIKKCVMNHQTDMVLSEKELYTLLFDDFILVHGSVNPQIDQLIHSWFPLPLWNTLTTLDGI